VTTQDVLLGFSMANDGRCGDIPITNGWPESIAACDPMNASSSGRVSGSSSGGGSSSCHGRLGSRCPSPSSTVMCQQENNETVSLESIGVNMANQNFNGADVSCRSLVGRRPVSDAVRASELFWIFFGLKSDDSQCVTSSDVKATGGGEGIISLLLSLSLSATDLRMSTTGGFAFRLFFCLLPTRSTGKRSGGRRSDRSLLLRPKQHARRRRLRHLLLFSTSFCPATYRLMEHQKQMITSSRRKLRNRVRLGIICIYVQLWANNYSAQLNPIADPFSHGARI
jgi:hypothetical protein